MTRESLPSGSGAPPSEVAARRVKVAVVLAFAVLVLLSFVDRADFWQALGLSLYGVLLPSLAVAQLPLLETIEVSRVSIYRGSAATILSVGAVAIALGWLSDGGAFSGLNPVSLPRTLLWAGGLTGAGLALIRGAQAVGLRREDGSAEFVLRLIPRTPRQKRLFVGLSIIAGFGEEVAYRGYMLTTLQLLGLGHWGAGLISSAAFGMLHAYQGTVGIVRTGLTGLALTLPVLVTGSLIPSIIAHALINIVAGLAIGPRMVAEAEGPP